MNTREYAQQLRDHAAELDGLPEFEVPTYYTESHKEMRYYGDRKEFVSAVRALGSGVKQIIGDNMYFRPSAASFSLIIDRNQVCKMVKPAQWDCEPWLTYEQEVIVDAASAQETEGIPF
jgi:hypothetical protein